MDKDRSKRIIALLEGKPGTLDNFAKAVKADNLAIAAEVDAFFHNGVKLALDEAFRREYGSVVLASDDGKPTPPFS
ncbi:MAG: hypothetical protein KDI46_08520 [Alphaproteobacteria bacterium]|nr:hypothetical protein [Alphaproteobacteria bacterium]